MKIYSFEKLEVWQDSKKMYLKIFEITKKFPESEKYNMISQSRRSSFSVTCNIAEGTSRWTNKEKSRYMEIAFSSLMETLNGLIIAFEMSLISEELYLQMRNEIDMIANKLNSLNSHFKNNV